MAVISAWLPLFPLRTALFPSVVLPLQVFEPRYIDMVSTCLKRETGFGVVLIAQGSEIYRPGTPSNDFHDIGTLAQIVDWDRLPNGHLGIKVKGGERFLVLHHVCAADGLVSAQIQLLPTMSSAAIPDDFEPLLDLWRELQNHPHALRFGMQEPSTAAELVWHLAQLLPLPDNEAIALLEHNDPMWCLKKIRYWVAQLAEGA